MAHKKSIIKESMERLDSLMAVGESRRAAKQELRKSGEHVWTFSTGRIHSYKTRTTYQEHILKFVTWSRQQYGIKRLVDLDQRADELATVYLQQHIEQDKSPYTLQVERAALRMFFSNRTLAQAVQLPRRTRTTITRSRGVKSHDRNFQPANWQPLIHFLKATGLRRQELAALRVHDIYQDHDGAVFVHIESGKGGRSREVPALPGKEQDVLSVVANRDPNESVFDRIPKHLDVHSYRREYAQALYLHHAPGRTLPPATGRLRPSNYDLWAAERVTWALGHNRIDVVLRHYIR